VDRPVSLYAATKVADELMAHTYHHLYGIPVTGLRFFTVYGPWGRPDMALFGFTRRLLAQEPIDLYNYGRMERDFTYIDDITAGVVAALDRPLGDEVVNLGNSRTVTLERFVAVLEETLGSRRARTTCRCSPATCLGPLPTCPGPRPCSDGCRPRPSRSASRGSWSGIGVLRRESGIVNRKS